MKSKFIFLGIFLSLQVVSSQINRKHIYLDENNDKISLEEFTSIDKTNCYIKKVQNDSLVMHKVINRIITKRLDSIQNQQINNLLEQIIGKKFNREKFTMIHYYDNNDSVLKKSKENKEYWRWVKRNSKQYQSFLIGSKNSGVNKNIKQHLYIDYNNRIKNIFLYNSDFTINHIYIKPNRGYKIYFGDDDILKILDFSVDRILIFSN